MVEWFSERLTEARCLSEPNAIFLFGDNEIRRGKGGQAVIRDCPNAIGIRTKRYPTMDTDAFWNDDDDSFTAQCKMIDEDLSEVSDAIFNGKTVYAPVTNENISLGTGRARLSELAPRTYDYLVNCLKNLDTQVFLRVGIVGSRRRLDKELIVALVDALSVMDVKIISGGCKGVDTWAVDRAKQNELPNREYSPDFSGFSELSYKEKCQRYFDRNRLIAKNSDIVFAFVAPDRKGGSENTIRHCEELFVPYVLVEENADIKELLEEHLEVRR